MFICLRFSISYVLGLGILTFKGLVFICLGVSDSYLLGLVFLRLWLVIPTFGG